MKLFKGNNLICKNFIKCMSIFLVFLMVISNFAIANAATAMETSEIQVNSAEDRGLLDILDSQGNLLYDEHMAESSQNVNGVFALLIDLKQYKAAYPDLYAVCGDEWEAYLNHYLTKGFYENLKSFGYFDAKAYADRYPDLKVAFGDDVLALYRHYIMFGMLEGRNGGAVGASPIVFDAKAYADRYPDLKEAFGDDAAALYRHFIMFGAAEGRNCGRDIPQIVNNVSDVNYGNSREGNTASENANISDSEEEKTSDSSTDQEEEKPDDSSTDQEEEKPDDGNPDEEKKPDDERTYTRAEWIHLLVQHCDLNYYNNNTQTNYYADTAGHQYEIEIEMAKSHNIIPVPVEQDEQDVPVFDPDGVADREFAAVTSVLALRYSGDGSRLECADSVELQYPEEDKIAVTTGIVKLENNSFYPRRALSSSEKDKILEKIDDLRSIQGNEEPISDIRYADGVVSLAGQEQINDYSVFDNGDGSYIVTIANCAETRAIEQGKCFVLPANSQHPSGMALKAVSVSMSDEKLSIIATKPGNIAEVVSHLEYEGQAEAIPGKAESLLDGVSVDYDPDGYVAEGEVAYLSRAAIGGSFSIPGKWTFKFGEGKEIGNHTKLSGDVEVTIPDVTAYLNMDFGLFSGVKVNEVTFSVTEKVKFNGKIEYTAAEAENGSIEFARFPFVLGATGFSVDIVFSLYYDVKGNVSIDWTVTATEGVQYVDNNFRPIGNFDSQVDIYKINGKGQIGIKPAINLVYFEIWDIIGVDGKVGAAMTVSVTQHINPTMECVDGTAYLSASCGLNRDTLLGEFIKEKLHYELEKEFYNENNSPLKLKFHFEDGERVETCTYGVGEIQGSVHDAVSRAPIKYARISVYCGDSLKAVTYTNDEGVYNISDGLPTNEYVNIKISATGYSTYTDTRMLNRNAVTYIEAYMLVGRGEEELGTVKGSIIDAITGDGVSDVKIEVREGWGNITGDNNIILSEKLNSKDYELSLLAGNYTILARHNEYIENSINVTIVAQGITDNKDIVLYPIGSEGEEFGQLKVVLTWGETPQDLDSHMFGSNIEGTNIFHTYYSDPDYYENGERIADLDRDDTDSYGPETTTVRKMNDQGVYSFYVHDYTNRDSVNSIEMSLSGAKVVVYDGDTQIAVYNVPTHMGGTVWHVFDYDASTSTLTPSNAMYYNSTPDDLGVYAYRSIGGGEFTDEMAVKLITETTSMARKDSDDIEDLDNEIENEAEVEDETETDEIELEEETETDEIESEDGTETDEIESEEETETDEIESEEEIKTDEIESEEETETDEIESEEETETDEIESEEETETDEIESEKSTTVDDVIEPETETVNDIL